MSTKPSVSPPGTEGELLQRAEALAGLTAGELARRLGRSLPGDTVRAKGSIGALVERALGATAGSQDLPDFPELGVELKTVPLDAAGHVRESTWVCSLDLSRVDREEWADSRVWRKLKRVLWIPVEAAAVGPPAVRHLGRPLLWSPDAREQALLRADWMELTGKLAVGGVEELTAHLGQALQVRPKARDGSVRVEVPGPEGEPLPAIPMGFYLRATFTERVLWDNS